MTTRLPISPRDVVFDGTNPGLRGLLSLLMLLGVVAPIGCRDDATTPIPLEEIAIVGEPTFAEQLAAVQRGESDEISLDRTYARNDDLAQLNEVAGLRRLALGRAILFDRDLKVLPTCPDLVSVEIRGPRFGDEALQILTEIEGLERINLTGTRVTDAGLRALTQQPNLTHLNLHQTRITDDGLEVLRELPGLVQVRLGSRDLTDDGLTVLTTLPNLRFLHLINSPITDAALSTIAEIESLESFYIDHTQITAKGLNSFYDQRKDVHLHVNAIDFVAETAAIASQGGDVVSEARSNEEDSGGDDDDARETVEEPSSEDPSV